MKKIEEYGLHHVGYVVTDRDETVKLMNECFGPFDVLRYSFKPMKAWCYGEEVENYELKIAMITLEKNKTVIEVIEPVSMGTHADLIKNPGINHICFSVDEGFLEYKKIFENNGAKIIFESETEDDVIGYRRCFYVQDTLGNIVEVKENPYFRK